jgi:hypothetical protein
MNSIGNQAPSLQKTRVHVIGHIDATESTVEPFLAHRVDDFKQMTQQPGSTIDGKLQVFRGGTTALKKGLQGLAKLGAHVAIPAAGFAVGGPVGLALGLLVDAGMFVAGVTRSGLGSIQSALIHKDHISDGDWKGSQTVTLGSEIQLSARDAEAKLSGDGLEKLLTENLQPDVTNVAYLSGHGLGIHQSAGLKTSEVAAALHGSREATGIRPDFLVLESCLQSNLEALSSFRGGAGVAIVSEEALSASEEAGGLPLSKLLADIAVGGTKEEASKRIIADAKANDIMTLAAVDVDKFGLVTDSLEPLGLALISDLIQGKQAAVQQAVKDSVKFPNMSMMPLEKALMNTSDLGGFLDHLQSSDLSPDSKEAARKTRELLNDSIIAHTEGAGYEGASGVSFQTATGFMDKVPTQGAFADANLPKAWGAFIDVLNAKDPLKRINEIVNSVPVDSPKTE